MSTKPTPFLIQNESIIYLSCLCCHSFLKSVTMKDMIEKGYKVDEIPLSGASFKCPKCEYLIHLEIGV